MTLPEKPKGLYETREFPPLDSTWMRAMKEELSNMESFRRGFEGRLSVTSIDMMMENFVHVIVDWLRIHKTCETMSSFIEEDDKRWIAIRRYCNGVDFGISTGVCETLTYGYGDLDFNGYWEFPLPTWFVRYVEGGRHGNECGTETQSASVEGPMHGSEASGEGD